MTIATACTPFRQFFNTNANPAAYATLTPLSTNALDGLCGSGVVKVDNSGISPNSFGTFVFWGVGSDADTFNTQIWGYRKTAYSDGRAQEYIPILLADLACTLGATTSAVTTTDKMVKSITATSIVAGSEIGPVATNCPIARVKIDLEGCSYIRMLPGTASGATKENGMMGGF